MQVLLCRHNHTLDEGCRKCLMPRDWRVAEKPTHERSTTK